MTNETRGWLARCLEWTVHRNPTYLVSAALMTVGARLLLVGPSDAAGDIGLILCTLSVLQVYEWAVSGILLLLHRAKRAGEDRPSLLLVAALFWTGPMAATIEMTAFRPELGTPLAVGACLIALAELRLSCRILGLRLSGAGQALGAACLVLLVATGPLAKVPEGGPGANELYLYGAWWVLAGLVLIGLPIARGYRRRGVPSGVTSNASSLGQELTFLTVTVAAAAAHLVGMNHAFCCHAVPFYASPLIVAVAVVGMEFLTLAARPHRWLLITFGVLPGVAILLGSQRFDAEVPVAMLPVWLRDPVMGILPAAAAAWWFGYSRHRTVALFHAGSAALLLTALREVGVLLGEPADSVLLGVGFAVPDEVWAAILYAATGYLVLGAWLRRSRVEAVVALLVHQMAVVVLVLGEMPGDRCIIYLVGGWSALAGVHLATRRPGVLVRLVPIALLAVAPWTRAAAPPAQWQAGIHAAAMILILFALGHFWRWTRYRLVAVLLLGGHLAVFVGRWSVDGDHLVAVGLVAGSFALLVGGALISWHKGRLLDSLRAEDMDQ